MTEIPEHLLKRSKARKGGGDAAAPAGDAASAAVTPAAAAPAAAPTPSALAAAAAAVPIDKPAEPAKPISPEVAAYNKRKRIPVFAMIVVGVLPLWGWAYAGTMQQPHREDALYTESAALYTELGCAGCHGASGGGGTGYQLSDGQVLSSFPSVVDQLVHVARGSDAIKGSPYGGQGRVSGDLGAMPSQEAAGISLLELELVVFHERAVLSGEDISTDEYDLYMEELRHRIAEGDEHEIEIEDLLACADPAMTPEATGDSALVDCFGPEAAVARADA